MLYEDKPVYEQRRAGKRMRLAQSEDRVAGMLANTIQAHGESTLVMQVDDRNLADLNMFLTGFRSATSTEGGKVCFDRPEIKASQSAPGTSIVTLKNCDTFSNVLPLLAQADIVSVEMAEEIAPLNIERMPPSFSPEHK